MPRGASAVGERFAVRAARCRELRLEAPVDAASERSYGAGELWWTMLTVAGAARAATSRSRPMAPAGRAPPAAAGAVR